MELTCVEVIEEEEEEGKVVSVGDDNLTSSCVEEVEEEREESYYAHKTDEHSKS